MKIYQTTLEKVNFNKQARGKSCILKLVFERLRRNPCGSELIKPEKSSKISCLTTVWTCESQDSLVDLISMTIRTWSDNDDLLDIFGHVRMISMTIRTCFFILTGFLYEPVQINFRRLCLFPVLFRPKNVLNTSYFLPKLHQDLLHLTYLMSI